MAHISCLGTQTQATFIVNGHVFCAVERKPDLRRVGTGFDDEVVFEQSTEMRTPLAGGVVVDDVDSRVDILEADSCEVGNIGPPSGGVIAEVVVAFARQAVQPGSIGPGVRANDVEVQQHGRLVNPGAQVHDHSRGVHPQRIPGAAAEE